MKVVFISGKFSGANSWEVEQNIRAAEAVAAQVWMRGMVAICPHTNARFMEGLAPYETWLAGTLEIMRRCDAVLLVSNWIDSSGARGEVQAAEILGLPIYGRDCDIPRALSELSSENKS